MGLGHSWNKVPIHVSISVERINACDLPVQLGKSPTIDKNIEQLLAKGTSTVWMYGDYTPLSPKMEELIAGHAGEQDWVEVEIDAESTGYYDPGICSGPPERCYPPEEEDERTITEVTLSIDGEDSVEIGEDQFHLFEQFDKEIYREEIMEDM